MKVPAVALQFQAVATIGTHRYLVRCENQPKALLVTISCQFGKDKLVEREEEGMPRRNFNA